jgi:hypothetical protein
MMRRILNLALVVLVIHAAWRIGPVYWQYIKFKEAVGETARFAGSRSEEDIRQRVTLLAERFGVPLAPETIIVKRDADQVFIVANYTVTLEPVPRYRKPWTFRVEAEAWTVSTGDSAPK